ncbi:hypothetical protein [Leptospira koniambonensis]|uniref:hypothetical protein n=1 Tax=Leptospira koniambonensis TaxID=2484950 RepID=UPI001ABFB07A|nr:hypothetical protein [Leptospira koniambonensis]
MVKLAISVMDKDFKKTYDPVNQENREEKIAALDPMAMAKVMQAAQGSLRSLLSDPKYMMASASDKKLMEQSAMSSGYLVGPTEGGVFGDWHFNQFYTPLKLKEKYDEMQQKGESMKGDGFANAAGTLTSVATLGMISPSQASMFIHENQDTINAVAAVAAVLTGPAGMIAFAAYKSVQGAYDGGVLGALAGAANIGNAYIQGMSGGSLSYEMSYSYKEGFGVSVGGGYRIADGLAIGGSLSYNADSGSINGSVGLQNRFDASGRFTGNLGVNFDNTGFTGVSAGVGIGLGNQDKNGNFAGSLNLGLSYDRNDGFGQSAGISENTNKFAPQSSFDYNHTAWGGNTYSVTTPSVAGITGTYSYNDITQGYTASLSANSATALTYDSISGDAVYNKGFFGDVGKAQGLALGAMTKDQYDKYVNDQTEVRTRSQGLWDKTTGFFGDAWDGMTGGNYRLVNQSEISNIGIGTLGSLINSFGGLFGDGGMEGKSTGGLSLPKTVNGSTGVEVRGGGDGDSDAGKTKDKFTDKKQIHQDIENKLDIRNHVTDVVTGGLLDGLIGVAKETGKILYSGMKGALSYIGIALEVGANAYEFQKKMKEIVETYDTGDAIKLVNDLLEREIQKAKREFQDVGGALNHLIDKRKQFLDTMEGKTTYITNPAADLADSSINQKYRDHNKEVVYQRAELASDILERNALKSAYHEKTALMYEAISFGEKGNYSSMLHTAEKALMYRGHASGFSELESIKHFQTVKVVGSFGYQTLSESASPVITINPTLAGTQKAYLEYMKTREENIKNSQRQNCQDRSYNGGYYVVPVCYN